ncbi:uncharacterized protein LOC131025528 [Salvia miltiorrhiza]|uniref:uncharacterized protein LOC131025528 n=1 Tax=Salvia miltiorrhiza TaxID=226208 RepID=UPI0025ACEC5F|nr:uncharacterized protein LOC131025528 [Salvia miltiorrhiza]
MCDKWWGMSNFDWAVRESEGRSGGILSVWNKDKFVATSKWNVTGAVIVNGIWLQGGLHCCFVNVYAPMGTTEKESLWDTLQLIALQNKDSCLCSLGDFNAVRDSGERVGKGAVFNQADARSFDAFIRQSNLLEIRTQGRKFTWYQPGGGCKSKLDRFMVNEKWMQEWPDTVGRGLQRSVSDHYLKDELQELDIFDDTFGLEESETIRRNELRAKIFLKSKEKWLEVGGCWIEDPKIIKENVKTFFENHFKKTPRVLPMIPGDFTARKISAANNAELIKPFSESEIKEAIWSCDGDKSPGPDGFNLKFWKASWDIIKKDFLKVLANRMKQVMDSVISDNQSAFIGGRYILDGVVVLNEAIAEASKKRKGRIIFKVDFAKAYDSVEWDFLDLMLERMDFEPLWRKWIRAEGLHSLITRAVEKELIKPVKVGNDDISIPHLQYADDTVFLMEDDERNAVAVKMILRVFQLLSGLAVNFKKCCLFGVGVEEDTIERMEAVLGCDVGSLPFNYLGIKVGSKGKKVADWKYLVEKENQTQ